MPQDLQDARARASLLGKAAAVVGAALAALAVWAAPGRIEAFRDGPLGPSALAELARARAQVGAVGGGLLVLGLALAWLRPRFAERRAFVRTALVLASALLPLFVLERGLRPFVERPTSLFTPDEELGWRLVPGAEDRWLGAPARVNAQGMRGPERALPKPAGTLRVLFLGDSVTFGAFVEEDAATIPARFEARVDEALPARVESLNAGVGGYSPWQELLVLREAAPRYEPDLVVLLFVLNDVTEKLDLARFGGEGEGFQLALRRRPGLVGWLESLSFVQWARRRGALERERMSVYELLLRPNDDDVQAAWKLTMKSLDGIVATCRERELPLLLAVVPHLAQLERPDLNAPQWILERFTGRRGVPFLDLLPPLLERMRAAGRTPDELYADGVHPNAAGCAILAEVLAERVLAAGLLQGGGR